MMNLWLVLPALALLAAAVVLAVRYRNLTQRIRRANRKLRRDEERLVGTLALAEETVRQILDTEEMGKTLSRMTTRCAELLDLSGVRIHLDLDQLDPTGKTVAHAQYGTCEGACTQRLPIRAWKKQIGSFWFTPNLDQPLSARSLHLLRLMSELVGIGVENLLFHQQVEAATEEKTRFILATTHDLRSPMTTVEQLTQVLLDGYAGPLNDKQRELLQKVKGRSEHQLQLIADLLFLAAEENAFTIPRERVTVSLGEVFDSQIEAIRPACEAKEITLVAERDDCPMTRTAVKGDLENLFGNLFSNAVKYTLPSGKVTISLKNNLRGCHLVVQDTGIGISEEALPNLFREYYRAPNAKEMTRHGTGLGLALVKKLVQKYGGEIQVQSEIDKGSTFEVILPAETGA